MATLPYFVLGPNAILSTIGLVRGPDRTTPTPADDWRSATVDVVIPALNEARHLPLCLASLMRQTMKPRQIVIVDDGSRDGTVEIAEAFGAQHGLPIVAIRRRAPIGKTPTIKRQARELDGDVEFILDADTVLESETYIERTVQELYQGVGIACACGTILPQRLSDRRRWAEAPEVRAFLADHPGTPSPMASRAWVDAARAVTNLYREALYLFLQRWVYRGQSAFVGSIASPIGCAVAYRRQYVRDLFDHFEPRFGDDLTMSEDIFIGFAMLDMGYRNVHLADVHARTVEPPVHRLPRQLHLWSSAFLQACYYFDPLLRSPFRRLRGRRRAGPATPPRSGNTTRDVEPAQVAALAPASGGGVAPAALAVPMLRTAETPSAATPGGATPGGRERRRIAEAYRQPFGRDWTAEHGRPAGWMLLMQAVEKIFFPTTLILMIVLQAWEALIVTVLAETAVGVGVLAYVMRGHRLQYMCKGILAAPIRYALVANEAVTIVRFAWSVWVTKDRRWRK
jgi:glycosyltransferase involved in cell wall biosynthesis